MDQEKVELRLELEKKYTDVYTTQELTDTFDVQGFSAPYVVVKRKEDGVLGSLQFTHSPRLYFNFVAD